MNPDDGSAAGEEPFEPGAIGEATTTGGGNTTTLTTAGEVFGAIGGNAEDGAMAEGMVEDAGEVTDGDTGAAVGSAITGLVNAFKLGRTIAPDVRFEM